MLIIHPLHVSGHKTTDTTQLEAKLGRLEFFAPKALQITQLW